MPTIEIDEELLELLIKHANAWGKPTSEFASDMLWDFVSACEETPREYNSYWENELDQAKAGMQRDRFRVQHAPRCSEHLARAIILTGGLRIRGQRIPLSTLSLLWGILSLPYASATRLLKENECHPLRLSELLMTKLEAVEADEDEWGVIEDNRIFQAAYRLAENKDNITSTNMLRAILGDRLNVGRLFLKRHAIEASTFGW